MDEKELPEIICEESEEYANLGKRLGVEQEPEETEKPFNAEKISISSVPVPLNRLIDRINKGTISAPEIQRNDNLCDIQKKAG